MEPFELHVATPRARRQAGSLAPPQRLMRWGRGAWIEDIQGQRFFDGTSSSGTVLFGHGDPAILDAVKLQLAHAVFPGHSGHTHAGVEQLRELLTTISPPSLSRISYSDGARSAIERALWMSQQHWQLVGKNKWRFVAFERSWHESLATETFLSSPTRGPVDSNPIVLTPAPPRAADLERDATLTEAILNALDRLLAIRGPEIAGLVIEPRFVADAGACLYDDEFFGHVLALCRQYDVHVIADETWVGLGRTGSLFACEDAPLPPDFMCLGPSLTSGIAPLGATMVSDTIELDPLVDAPPRLQEEATPSSIATAAAISILERFESADVLADVSTKGKALMDAAGLLLENEQVVGVDHRGLVFIIDVEEPAETDPTAHELLASLVASELERDGILSFVAGRSICLMPPLDVSKAELTNIVERIPVALKRAARL